MNRRSFFTKLASGLVIATYPQIFIPKTFAPTWKKFPNYRVNKNNDAYRENFACVMGPMVYTILKTQTASAFITPVLYGCFESIDDSLVIPMDLYYGPKSKIYREGSIV